MAHFYGTVQGSAGKTTRRGTKSSGMETYCASWQGAVRCMAYGRSDGVDCIKVVKVLWKGAGENRVLYDGPIGKVEECDRPRIDNSPHFPDAE